MPETPDVSMFRHDDLVMIALQRSEVLAGVPEAGRMIRAWAEGESLPLDVAVMELGTEIAERAMADATAEVAALAPRLRRLAPGRVADIGCGHGLFALALFRLCAPHLLLIDIETTRHRYFGFRVRGAGYASLARAQAFLAANGVPPGRITAINPLRADPMAEAPVDLALSLRACGFHFPVDAYLPYFRDRVRPGGLIVLDLRRKRARQDSRRLAELGPVETLAEGRKRVRVAIERRAA